MKKQKVIKATSALLASTFLVNSCYYPEEFNLQESEYGRHTVGDDTVFGKSMLDISSYDNDLARFQTLGKLVDLILNDPAFADMVYSSMKEGDTVLRYGAEEFSVSKVETKIIKGISDPRVRNAVLNNDLDTFIAVCKDNKYFSSIDADEVKGYLDSDTVSAIVDASQSRVQIDTAIAVVAVPVVAVAAAAVATWAGAVNWAAAAQIVETAEAFHHWLAIKTKTAPNQPVQRDKSVIMNPLLRESVSNQPLAKMWEDNAPFSEEDAISFMAAAIEMRADQITALCKEAGFISDEQESVFHDYIVKSAIDIYLR